ncbi:hypothetical protein BJF85_23950 [Saccharomonospora sp. CUA-673]|uniref:alpha/beta hydrolase n=1 Tax=Saccharomonospora sp. CUA-673 TaxID=1904969 RepID=UPI00095E1C3A|nr:alpha/beta hydrolase [Saccharomonospora sp. CUA-673]OLT41339.1 hypothetical protein BJF85_23950 [Saccharomonospora sp. CUA-673]
MNEHRVTVDGRTLNIAEGPDNGPPVVLLHGQASRWQDFRRVLPALTTRHRVIAIDVPGHGASEHLNHEEYTCVTVGELLAGAIEKLTDDPVLLSGHSSGGVLAVQIAANHPEMVRGLLLEDPPLFSSVPPRGDKTTGAVLHRIAAEYLHEQPDGGFQRYYLERADYFEFFGKLAPLLTRWALRRVDRHPDEPLRIRFLPRAVDVWFEGMVDYDPAFGNSWHVGRWYEGFSTDSALAAIKVPTTLIHTRWWFDKHGSSYDENGILKAAMDVEDASRALALLADAELVPISGGHLVHFERPKDYLAALHRLGQRCGRRR